MSAPALRWGVLAPTAMIARLALIPAMLASPDATVAAVGSLSVDEDAGRPLVPGLGPGVRWHRSYDAVIDDPSVDAVYVPLPNSLHREWVEAALAAGKHVLCEKPLAMSASDAESMVAAAAAAGRVLLEAYMTPHHPRSRALAALVADGELGEPRFGQATFTGQLGRPGNHRWDPAMGGGALLDVGIYCLAPLLAFGGGEPVTVAAASVAGEDPAGGKGLGGGRRVVDESFAGLLTFERGLVASFSCSFDAAERQALELVGTAGSVAVERACTPGPEDKTYVWRDAADRATTRMTAGGELYRLMVEQFGAVVAGEEPPLHPLEATLAVTRTVDRLRAAVSGR
jgi:predicted dehydrogenase